MEKASEITRIKSAQFGKSEGFCPPFCSRHFFLCGKMPLCLTISHYVLFLENRGTNHLSQYIRVPTYQSRLETRQPFADVALSPNAKTIKVDRPLILLDGRAFRAAAATQSSLHHLRLIFVVVVFVIVVL